MKANGEEAAEKKRARPLVVLADLLVGKEHNRHTIQNKLGVRPAAADEILNLLVDHAPGVVAERRGRSRWIRFDAGKIAQPPEHPVAVAACFGASLAGLFEGTDYDVGMRKAVSYVLQRSRRGKQFKHIERKFIFVRQGGEPSIRERGGEFDELVEALIHDHPIRFKYRSASRGASDKLVEPLSIAVYDHQLYIIARDAKGRLTPYRFSRTSELEAVDDTTFTYPPQSEYDPHEFFARYFGIHVGDDLKPERVVVRLTGPWVPIATSHRWHKSQRVQEKDGHVDVELFVPVCAEVQTWVLGFGEHAEVVEPISLRKTIDRRIAAAAARLRPASSSVG